MKNEFEALHWEKYVPLPVYDAHPEYNDLYMKAWELAYAHIKYIDGMPQNPYMDEAFCETQIWIWDTCFMSLFCKYSQNVFPGVESLKNFYEVLCNKKSLPAVIPPLNEPSWTRAIPGVPFNIQVHIADNPPLFAWAEYENALFRGDVDYIKELLYKKQALQRHYDWIEGLNEQLMLPNVKSKTFLIAEKYGYLWEGGRSGMDNTPRGRTTEHAERPRPNNPDMLWIDAICQQALSADIIAKMYQLVGDKDAYELWNKRYNEKKDIVNAHYWDSDDGFYYDIDRNTQEFYRVMTIASYWTLTAGIATEERAEALADMVSDPDTFGGNVPLISLSRSDSDFQDDGSYWRGSLWLPTAYAALCGLNRYGYFEKAREAGLKILNHMYVTYKDYEPHTVWEAYSPTKCVPATAETNDRIVRKDFCGWSALGPISVYIECVLGFSDINAFERVVQWNRKEGIQGRVGIKNLRFGDVVTDIIANKDRCEVISNAPYVLKINSKEYLINKGVNRFVIC